jgi:hypothetical protein
MKLSDLPVRRVLLLSSGDAQTKPNSFTPEELQRMEAVTARRREHMREVALRNKERRAKADAERRARLRKELKGFT